MARYCKSCGSVSKVQIPLFIVFIAAFIEKSVFLSFYIAQTYNYIIIIELLILPLFCNHTQGQIQGGALSRSREGALGVNHHCFTTILINSR